MIEKPIVLVIGAGASATYGFPTGRGLASTIISNLRPLSKNQSRGPVDWIPFLVNNFGIDQEDIYEFLTPDRMIERRLSLGGTATKRVRAAIKKAETQLVKISQRYELHVAEDPA